LEAIERDFSANEWETLDAQPFAIDENFTAVLDGYGDLFAYVLKIEGQFDPKRVHGLIAGYVSPETLQDRASELQGVDLDALEKAGYLETHTSQKYGTSFESLKQFIQSAASEKFGTHNRHSFVILGPDESAAGRRPWRNDSAWLLNKMICGCGSCHGPACAKNRYDTHWQEQHKAPRSSASR